MDYPLGEILIRCSPQGQRGLNPYSNGLPSRGELVNWIKHEKEGRLNPYSNGLPSRGWLEELRQQAALVLIPILMDYPLGAISIGLISWLLAS